MNARQYEIRRNTISCFLIDHPSVGFDDIQYISNETGIDYDSVANDVRYLKKKYQEENKKYNLEELFKNHKEKAKRLEELQKKAAEIIEGAEQDSDKLHAIRLETEIINNRFMLETDGLVPMAEELQDREKIKSKAELKKLPKQK